MTVADVVTDIKNPLARSDVSTFRLDDDLVLSKGQDGQVFVLNSTGAFIWNLCDGHHSVTSIADAVVDHFGVSVSEATVDVRDLIGELLAAELLSTD